MPPWHSGADTGGGNSMSMMSITRNRAAALAFAAAALGGLPGATDAAPSVKLLTMIPVPGEPLESYDIGTVDEKTHLYYQTDRSNKSIDIFDVIKNTFVARVPG